MKTTTSILSFDHSFEGFLSAVYTSFDEQLDVIAIHPARERSALLFSEARHIPADRQKACQVWDWLNSKGTSELRLAYFAFLSEKEEVLLPLLEFITGLFREAGPGSPERLSALRGKLAPWARRVEKEKQKLEAHLKYNSGQGGFNGFRLRPVFDILPLLTKCCRERFGSDPWVLADTKRNYGLRGNCGGVEYFQLSDGLSGLSGNIAGVPMQEGNPEASPHALEPLQEAV